MGQGKTGLLGKIAFIVSAIGPGLFMIGYNIGTGSVTTMASAGSRFGMGLFWTLLLSCLFTYVMIISFGKYTVVTGETAMEAFKKHLPFGKWIAIYSIIGMTIGAFAGLAGVVGIVSDLIREWTAVLFGGGGFNMLATAIVIIGGCYTLMWFGVYSSFEKFLSFLVFVMGVCFFISMFIVIPDPFDVLKGMIPSVQKGDSAFIIIAAMAGTTCGALLFVMRSILVAEKGWGIDDLKKENTDAFVSVLLMLLISGAIMACAAGTLYKMGIPVERAVDMVNTLEPVAGRFAMSIFVVGIIGAGVSSTFPIALVLPWLISDYTGTPRNSNRPMYRIIGALSLMTGLTVPLIGGRPVWIMIGSTAFQATLLPIVTGGMLVLINCHDLMGDRKAGLWLNLGIISTLLFSLATAYMGIVGLIERFSG